MHDLLTLAAADEGSLALATEPVDLHATAGRVLDHVRALAHRREVDLRLAGASAITLADPERLEHAVGNLVENAIEFSPRGGRVELTTSTTAGSATLTVADTARGSLPSTANGSSIASIASTHPAHAAPGAAA